MEAAPPPRRARVDALPVVTHLKRELVGSSDSRTSTRVAFAYFATFCSASRQQKSRRHPHDQLTLRQREVLALMAEGLSNAGIAQRLVVTEGAVEKHVTSILAKPGLERAETDYCRVLAVLRYLEDR